MRTYVIDQLELEASASDVPFPQYANDPIAFTRDVLKIERLTLEQEEICQSIRLQTVTNVRAANGVGKCVAASDYIRLADGTRVEARTLPGTIFELKTVFQGKIVKVFALAQWNSIEPEPILRLTTQSGLSIDRNLAHPLWIKDKGWTRFEDIQVGDYCALMDESVSGQDAQLPACLKWEQVTQIKSVPDEPTVAICVPFHETYLSDFYEHNSFLAASLTLWWVFSVGGKVVTTAPNAEQVEQILWSEIRGMYDANKSVLGGRRTQISLYLTEKAQAFGFATKDYDANAFQGKHGEKLLLILDEACGITREIDDAAISCITGAENRLLRIGNPISDNNPFADACAAQSIAINSWSHPNVSWAYQVDPDDGIHKLKPEIAALIVKPDDDPTKPTDPILPQANWPAHLPRDVIPGACSINWLEMVRVLKRESSSFWQSRVEAHFPEDTDRSIVPRSWFKAARARYDANPEKWDALVAHLPARHALDVGDGGDPHAHALVRGCVVYSASEMNTIGDRLDVGRAADWGIEHLKANKGGIAVDRIGVGAGALSKILTYLSEENPALGLLCWATGVNFGQVVKKRKKHLSLLDDDATETLNVRAKHYWEFREAARLGELVIAPLGNVEEKVAEEFAKHYYEDTPSGKIKMEDKRITKRRLKRSPNLADVIVMAWNSEDDSDTKALEDSDDASVGMVVQAPV